MRLSERLDDITCPGECVPWFRHFRSFGYVTRMRSWTGTCSLSRGWGRHGGIRGRCSSTVGLNVTLVGTRRWQRDSLRAERRVCVMGQTCWCSSGLHPPFCTLIRRTTRVRWLELGLVRVYWNIGRCRFQNPISALRVAVRATCRPGSTSPVGAR